MDSQAEPVQTTTPVVVTENPQIETASEDGRVIAGLPGFVHPGELPIEFARQSLPFAARFQAILIVVMFAAFLQIAFGNIPPTTRFLKSMGLLVMTWAIVAVLIVVAVQITPSLIQLG